MEVKDRVKLNVYKTLLEEEKRKNKKIVAVGASLFVIGVFSDGLIEKAKTPLAVEKSKVAFETSVNSNTSKKDVAWESFFEGNVVQEKDLEFSADDLFVLDFGI